jgi:hypothetical protein
MNTMKHLTPAKKDTANQSIAGEKQHARSISAPLPDKEENFIQEMPKAALVAAQAYLLTTRRNPEIHGNTCIKRP